MIGAVGRRCGFRVPCKLLSTPSLMPLTQPTIGASPIRAFSNAARDVNPDGFWVSKKAVERTLLLGVGLAGAYLYLSRENVDKKAIRLLLELSQANLEKGNIEQSMKEKEKAFNLLKEKFPDDKSLVTMALAIGSSYEKFEKYVEAIPFYHDALQFVSLEPRRANREDVRVLLLDRLGQCCKQTGDVEAAERCFKQAIDAYDQFKGQLLLTPKGDSDLTIVVKLDEDILNVFLHYTVLLTTLQRSDEATHARRRLVAIACGSPQLRNQVRKIERQVDDFIALEKFREERKQREQLQPGGENGSDYV